MTEPAGAQRGSSLVFFWLFLGLFSEISSEEKKVSEPKNVKYSGNHIADSDNLFIFAPSNY